MKYFIHLPMKMEPIVCSETSAIKSQTPGNYPKRNKLHLSLRFPYQLHTDPSTPRSSKRFLSLMFPYQLHTDPSTPRSSKWFLSLRFPYQLHTDPSTPRYSKWFLSLVSLSVALSPTCHMSCSSHSPLFCARYISCSVSMCNFL